MNDSYKIYQLISFFVMNHSYKIINISSQKADEVFLINPDHNYYPMIRLTLSSIEQVTFDKDRLHNAIDAIFSNLKIKNGRFLDIHVNRDTILDTEEFDSIAIDSGYYSGPDISDIYPRLKNVVHEVSEPLLEIKSIMDELATYSKTSKTQKRKLRFNDIPIVTYITIGICVIFYILTIILESSHTSVDAMIALGANYKTFTVGLKEFWRLFTCGFIHSGIFHLLFNMISLFSLGVYLERTIGSKRFAMALYGSLLVASLTSLAFSDNTVSVGLSGGLYGLFAMYLVSGFYNHTLNNSSTIQVIIINLIINFIGGVDIFAHIGGFVAGIIFYYFLENKSSIIIYLVIIITLVYRVYISESKYTIYGGTDLSVVEIYKELGLKNYADHLQTGLYEVWRNNQ